MHVAPDAETMATAEWITRTGGLVPVPPRRARSGRPRNPGRTWLGWTWFLPLITLGFAGPVLLLVGAARTRRRWLWLAWAALVDAFTLFMATGGGSTTPGGLFTVAYLIVWLGSTAVLLAAWIAIRRSEAPGLPGPVNAPPPG
jgi:hypothetical protein